MERRSSNIKRIVQPGIFSPRQEQVGFGREPLYPARRESSEARMRRFSNVNTAARTRAQSRALLQTEKSRNCLKVDKQVQTDFGNPQPEPVACYICFESLLKTRKQPVVIPCGHVLCLDCLQNVVRSVGSHCPACKRNFSSESLIKLHFL